MLVEVVHLTSIKHNGEMPLIFTLTTNVSYHDADMMLQKLKYRRKKSELNPSLSINWF